MHVSAIIAAGGRGLRMGGARAKQFVELGGRAVLDRSVSAFAGHPEVGEVVVALPAELMADPPSYLRGRGDTPVRLVAGGVRRQDSVANALAAVDARAEIVLVHDAARPFVSASLIARTIAAATEAGAALAAVPARDTVKRVVGAQVVETIARETIYLAQTPQGFRREVLSRALAAGRTIDVTDEAALAEAIGCEVRVVEGEASNLKITTPDDLVLAEAIARARDGRGAGKPARTGRVGTGYDLHRLVPGRPLIVGGVTVESDRGALGHSDADVVCHAVTDAILGAVSLGDIGRHFPDSDDRWKGASSLDLLARAAALVAGEGYEVGNVDVTVILERPRIKDHIDAMRRNVAAAAGIAVDRVSIKGKTNEGLDALGRAEAIAAHAVAILRSR
ncbi:MAG: 2-C-methyl-D-erythritol 4-phosphate cytidylyltransferase [Betaproteobacteria bacterium]